MNADETLRDNVAAFLKKMDQFAVNQFATELVKHCREAIDASPVDPQLAALFRGSLPWKLSRIN